MAPSQIPAWSLNKVSDGHTNMRDDLLELRESGHHFDPIKPLPPAQDNVILATSKVIWNLTVLLKEQNSYWVSLWPVADMPKNNNNNNNNSSNGQGTKKS